MAVIRNTILIDLPVSKVFHFVSNPINLPLWNYNIQSVERISPGRDEVGARYYQLRKNDAQFFVVTLYEKDKFIKLKSESKSSLHFIRQIAFSDIDNNTRIDDCFEIDSGYPIFLEKLFVNNIKNAVRENLDRLKELLETGKTKLQDDREIIV